MVELALREAVVDEERHTRLQRGSDGAHQALGGEADLGQVVVIPGREHRLGAPLEVALGQALVVPHEARVAHRHSALEDLAVLAMHQREGHHVEHLVRDHEAADLLRQPVDPHEALEILAVPLGDPRALALAQVRAHLEHEIALRRAPHALQLPVQVRREHARAGTELEDVAAHGLHHLGRLARDALRVHVGDLGAGHEVALAAELARPRGVVAQAGRVERELHEARERDPVAGARDLRGDVLRQPLRMRRRFGRWRGKYRVDGERHRGAFGYTSHSFF
jgi:hypothetical protein